MRGCAFSPAHGNLMSCSYDSTIKLWDAATGLCTATGAPRGRQAHDDVVCCCAFSPDGATVASGDASGGLQLWRRE